MPEDPLISALGCAIRIDVSALPDDEAAEVARVWADAEEHPAEELPAAHRTVAVSAEGDFAQRLSALSQNVTLTAIEARRGELWMLHAAAVADEEGRVIALVGPSGRGKTTAARALGEHFSYVTDETVAITATGRVAPYRKPLSVIDRADGVKSQHPPADLGLRALPDSALRLVAIVILERDDAGPDVPTIESCDLGDVLPELVEQTSYLADLPHPLQTIAAHADAVGGVRRVVYREASTLADALESLFVDGDAVELPEAQPRTHLTNARPGIYRGAYLDVVELDEPDRIAVLQPDYPEGATLRVIAGIAPALWRTADGADREVLLAAAIDAYGAPPETDAASAVDDAVAELLEQGVLATEPSWRIRDDVAWTGEDDRFVALQLSNLMDPTPVALEGSAAVIWGVLAASRGSTVTALIDRVAVEAGVVLADVDADVRGFLTSLEAGALAELIAP